MRARRPPPGMKVHAVHAVPRTALAGRSTIVGLATLGLAACLLDPPAQTTQPTVAAPAPPPSDPPTLAPEIPANGEIGPMGGTISFGEITLDVPPGALHTPMKLTIRPGAPLDIPAGIVPRSTVVELGPDGLVFDRNVTLRFRGGLSSSAAEPGRRLGLVSEHGGRFEQTRAERRPNGEVVAQLRHFSKVFVVDATLPEDATVADIETDPLARTTCSTSGMAPLANQIASLLPKGSLVRPSVDLLGDAIDVPFVQPVVASTIDHRLEGTPRPAMTSAWWAPPAQNLVSRWLTGDVPACVGELGANTLGATHDEGLAVDFAAGGRGPSWRVALESGSGAKLVGGGPYSDHFTYEGSNAAELRGQALRAFQYLWDANNPCARLPEDEVGVLPPAVMTELRMRNAPARGFPSTVPISLPAVGAGCAGALLCCPNPLAPTKPSCKAARPNATPFDSCTPRAHGTVTWTINRTQTCGWSGSRAMTVTNAQTSFSSLGNGIMRAYVTLSPANSTFMGAMSTDCGASREEVMVGGSITIDVDLTTNATKVLVSQQLSYTTTTSVGTQSFKGAQGWALDTSVSFADFPISVAAVQTIAGYYGPANDVDVSLVVER